MLVCWCVGVLVCWCGVGVVFVWCGVVMVLGWCWDSDGDGDGVVMLHTTTTPTTTVSLTEPRHGLGEHDGGRGGPVHDAHVSRQVHVAGDVARGRAEGPLLQPLPQRGLERSGVCVYVCMCMCTCGYV